jgi:N-dimethylarginine dimethylaminohydrolase
VHSLDRFAEVYVVSAIECAPRHADPDGCAYRVAWSINPHMRGGLVDRARARAQHDGLRGALVQAGAAVVEIPFVHGAYDSVFTKDSAILVERGSRRRALIASPRFAERQQEVEPRRHALAELGFELVHGCPARWEGGDVVFMPDGDGVAFGYGQRSEQPAADWLSEQLGAGLLGVELRDPHLFHLDMALAPLPDGTLLVCEDALAPASVAALRRAHGGPLVAVRREEALRFALNMVTIGDRVILGARARSLEGELRRRGLRPIVTTLDQFHLAGGSAACLVARLHRDRRDSALVRAPARPWAGVPTPTATSAAGEQESAE